MIDNRNMVLAIVLSIAIIIGFQVFYEMPRFRAQQEAEQAAPTTQETDVPRPTAPPGAPAPALPGAAPSAADREAVLASGRRLRIDSPRLRGSISLVGGRVDDLTLADYRESLAPDSPGIVLLSPPGTEKAYFAEFGWQAGSGQAVALPDADTPWQADAEALAPDAPVTLSWDNGAGLVFTRRFELDRDYMLSVTQRVENHGTEPVTLYPFGLVLRQGTPSTLGFFILHEGPLGVFNGTLEEQDYDDVVEADGGRIEHETTGGWIGITDKYWLVALVPDQETMVKSRFLHHAQGGTDKYQVDYLGPGSALAPGTAIEARNRLFAGAKEVKLLDRYVDSYDVPLFDRAVDWGWFYWITRPIFFMLDYFHGILGNFGLAILLLTVLIKLAFFPLANKSYRAMSAMKLLQPKMIELRERYGDDKQRLNQEMMALYKREKVNPVSGCLPMVIQIPVFFALYKVLFITIEMRHAPFYGWIQDLSAPDPTSMFDLFGMAPWDAPAFLRIGLWPLLMGLTMFLQQKLNPQPADPMQAKVFMLLPIFFTFLLAQFPAGLVIYWAWNNILSIAQQWVIMRRHAASTKT
jgi:YidC/Oxa1 family membrane protein insertase